MKAKHINLSSFLVLLLMCLLVVSPARAATYGKIFTPVYSYEGATSILGYSHVALSELMKSFGIEEEIVSAYSTNQMAAQVEQIDGEW